MKPVSSRVERVLVIDDDPSMLALVQGLLNGRSISVHAASSLQEARSLLQTQTFELIVLDHLLPDGCGLEELPSLLAQDRLRPILYITALLDSNTPIEAIKRGAFDYLAKPLDFAPFKQRLLEALEYRSMTRSPVLRTETPSPHDTHGVLVGRSASMQEVYKAIGRLSAMNCPVLLVGEVGSGKESVARAIHQHTHGVSAPFLQVFPDERHHTFTRESLQSLVGAPSSIDRGTLYLEDIGQWPLRFQSDLLQFLRTQPLNDYLRVIVSTSLAPTDLMEQKQLRSDLYYHLASFTVTIPALRHRSEDIDVLVSFFMESMTQVSAMGSHQGNPRVSPSALEVLRKYSWPGNVAQLRSVVQALLHESRGTILANDALRRHLCDNPPCEVPREDSPSIISRNAWDVAEFARARIEAGTQNLYDEALALLDQYLLPKVLAHTQSNQAQAAKILGMTRTSLRRKCHAFPIAKNGLRHSRDIPSMSDASGDQG